MNTQILGELSPAHFLKDFWQKKPLLIRKAFPHFQGIITKEKLLALACQEDVQSRLVQYHKKNKWTLDEGPFRKTDFKKINSPWTLLVQGVNYFHEPAQSLLQLFNFIPYQRLDDLMISFATDGGGVGPHFDSYDVFLLQGTGKRLWQISDQTNRDFLKNSPLRVLKKFEPQQEWILEPGDMLYLPPKYAHHGVAIGECTTYSIGFRAPSYRELMGEFLHYLEERIEVDGFYEDPDLTLSSNPAQITSTMIKRVYENLNKFKFDRDRVSDFLGRYLSEPKPYLYFEEPSLSLEIKVFEKLIKQHPIKLELKSQLLFTHNKFYLNGESFPVVANLIATYKELANNREAHFPSPLQANVKKLLYRWYQEGYIKVG